MTVNVLVTTPYLEGDGVAEAIAAVNPLVRVHNCRYVEPAEQRSARSERSDVPIGSELTDSQRAALADAHVLVALDVPPDLLSVAPGLRWCHLISSGTSHVAGSGLPAPGVALTHSPGGNAAGVAEFALARTLEFAKSLPEMARSQRAGKWQRAPGRRVAGLTMAIIGYGHVGRELDVRARALGMNVTAVVQRRPDPAGADDVRFATELTRGVAGADVVVLCAADRPENHGMVDRDVFAAMKPGALFINVARGALVHDEALMAALRSDQLAAAALDVTSPEPLPDGHPFWDMENVRLSFHSASTQDGMLDRRLEMFTANLRRWLAGESLQHRVNRFSSTDRPPLP